MVETLWSESSSLSSWYGTRRQHQKLVNTSNKNTLLSKKFIFILQFILGLPWWLGQLRIHLQCTRPRFNPWVGKIPWKMEWLVTPVFLPGEFHGQRSLASYSPWGCKELDMTERPTLSLSHLTMTIFIVEWMSVSHLSWPIFMDFFNHHIYRQKREKEREIKKEK